VKVRANVSTTEEPDAGKLHVRDCAGGAGQPASLRQKEPLILESERATLRILLGNLIRNACFYTLRGHIRITVDHRGVEVEDTGVGFDPTRIGQALGQGYRDPAKPGAGIGLSLARRLCERNGWKLILESKQGRGTCARVSLRSLGA
jgi:signal transduction histidine kinase